MFVPFSFFVSLVPCLKICVVGASARTARKSLFSLVRLRCLVCRRLLMLDRCCGQALFIRFFLSSRVSATGRESSNALSRLRFRSRMRISKSVAALLQSSLYSMLSVISELMFLPTSVLGLGCCGFRSPCSFVCFSNISQLAFFLCGFSAAMLHRYPTASLRSSEQHRSLQRSLLNPMVSFFVSLR